MKKEEILIREILRVHQIEETKQAISSTDASELHHIPGSSLVIS